MKRFLAVAALLAATCGTTYADNIGIRAAVADTKTAESFEAYELFVVLDLPWAWDQGAMRLQSQLEATGGVLDAAGETGLLGTLGPRMAFIADRLTFDVGAGVAVLGTTQFGRHDFAGSSQFIAQVGLGYAVTGRLNAGIRFRHMSDAAIHDDAQDMNLLLLELSYDYFEQR